MPRLRSLIISSVLMRKLAKSIAIMIVRFKKNKGLVAKPYNYVSNDGIVRLGAFKVDNTGQL